MSTASANNLQAAAGVAAAVAAALATQQPNATLNAASVASILGVVLQAAGTVNPNAGAVIALASIGLQAMHVATTTGAGLTPEQFAALGAADDAAYAADRAAHPAVPPTPVATAYPPGAPSAFAGLPIPLAPTPGV